MIDAVMSALCASRGKGICARATPLAVATAAIARAPAESAPPVWSADSFQFVGLDPERLFIASQSRATRHATEGSME